MLVVDASCLYEVVAGGDLADEIRQALTQDQEQGAPHIVDVEVFGVIRREHRHGRLDMTAATQAIEDLRTWPGERYGHRAFLDRAWQLRDTVRGWDAMYVALAEALGATLLTTDVRLSQAAGPTCGIELFRAS